MIQWISFWAQGQRDSKAFYGYPGLSFRYKSRLGSVVAPASVVMTFLFSAKVGILFGFWPTRKVSLLVLPIEALRYE